VGNEGGSKDINCNCEPVRVLRYPVGGWEGVLEPHEVDDGNCGRSSRYFPCGLTAFGTTSNARALIHMSYHLRPASKTLNRKNCPYNLCPCTTEMTTKSRWRETEAVGPSFHWFIVIRAAANSAGYTIPEQQRQLKICNQHFLGSPARWHSSLSYERHSPPCRCSLQITVFSCSFRGSRMGVITPRKPTTSE